MFRFRFRDCVSASASASIIPFPFPDSIFLCCRELNTKIETNKSEILFKKEIKIH